MGKRQDTVDHADWPGDSDGDLRLCIANPWFYPVLVGPGERFRRYAVPLARRGIRTSVATVRWDDLPHRDQVDGIEILRFDVDQSSRRSVQSFVNQLLPIIRDPSQRPDVLQVFAYSIWSYPFVRKARRYGVPAVLVFTLLGKDEGSRLRRSLRGFLRRRLFGVYDCIVTSSDVMTHRLIELGVTGPRFETIPNGVDLGRFRPVSHETEKAELRSRLNLPPDRTIATFIGGLIPRKGVDILLEAWSMVSQRFPNAQLALVGPRPRVGPVYERFQKRIDSLVGQLQNPGSVCFTGPVDNVEDYLRASDLFVFPSEREGMPNVVPEAMATGLACVLTPFDGLPTEFGAPGREYMLCGRDPVSLAAKLCTLLERPDLRGQLGDRAREWVVENLDVERSLDSFASLYRDLASMRFPESRE